MKVYSFRITRAVTRQAAAASAAAAAAARDRLTGGGGTLAMIERDKDREESGLRLTMQIYTME